MKIDVIIWQINILHIYTYDSWISVVLKQESIWWLRNSRLPSNFSQQWGQINEQDSFNSNRFSSMDWSEFEIGWFRPFFMKLSMILVEPFVDLSLFTLVRFDACFVVSSSSSSSFRSETRTPTRRRLSFSLLSFHSASNSQQAAWFISLVLFVYVSSDFVRVSISKSVVLSFMFTLDAFVFRRVRTLGFLLRVWNRNS